MTQPQHGGPTPRHQLQLRRVRFQEGYDIGEVDAFLERAYRAWETRDGSVSAREVRDARFSPRRREGYEMAQVNTELDRLATALRQVEPSSSGRAVEPPTPYERLRLTVVRWREGYDPGEVDEFLQRAHRALQSRDGSVTASDVRGVRFTARRLRGYEMSEVDDELERLAAALEEIDRPTAT